MYFQDYSDSFSGLDKEYLFTASNLFICEYIKKNASNLSMIVFIVFFPEPIDCVYWKYNFYQFSIKLLLELSFQCLTMSGINAVDSTQIMMMMVMMVMMMPINFTIPEGIHSSPHDNPTLSRINAVRSNDSLEARPALTILSPLLIKLSFF